MHVKTFDHTCVVEHDARHLLGYVGYLAFWVTPGDQLGYNVHKKISFHTMVFAPAGSGYVAAALDCGRGVRGNAVGPGSTAPPHIYPDAF